MPLSNLLTPYEEALRTNGLVLAVLVAVWGSGCVLRSMALLWTFMVLTLAWGVLELVLCAKALLTGRFRLALVYGCLFVLVAKLDWWLLEQAE